MLRMRKFEYRNIAPMYVGEKYTIAGRVRRKGAVDLGEGQTVPRGRVYELWVETPQRGLCVKGVAVVEEVVDEWEEG